MSSPSLAHHDSPLARDKNEFEKFTDKARKVLVLAQDEARALHQPYVGTEHILLGLIQEKDGLAAQALDRLSLAHHDSPLARDKNDG